MWTRMTATFCQFYVEVLYREDVRAERSCVTASDAAVVMTAQSPVLDESVQAVLSCGRMQRVPNHGRATIVHSTAGTLNKKDVSKFQILASLVPEIRGYHSLATAKLTDISQTLCGTPIQAVVTHFICISMLNMHVRCC